MPVSLSNHTVAVAVTPLSTGGISFLPSRLADRRTRSAWAAEEKAISRTVARATAILRGMGVLRQTTRGRTASQGVNSGGRISFRGIAHRRRRATASHAGRAIAAVLEDVPDIVLAGRITLGVELQGADDRVPGLAAQRVRHFGGVGRAGLGGRQRPHLNGGVAVESVALGLVSFLPQRRDDLARCRQVAQV